MHIFSSFIFGGIKRASHHIIVLTETTFHADLCLTSPSWADACCPRWHAWSVWWRCWGKGRWVWRGPYSPSSLGSAADTSSWREKAGSGPSWKPQKSGLLICRWKKYYTKHIQEKKALTNCCIWFILFIYLFAILTFKKGVNQNIEPLIIYIFFSCNI